MADDPKSLTREALARLPRWPRAAFAARCARRVLPLLAQFWPTAPRDDVAAAARAVDLAEGAAAAAVVIPDHLTIDDTLTLIGFGIMARYKLPPDPATAVYRIARAAGHALRVPHVPDDADLAAEAARLAAWVDIDLIAPMVAWDFRRCLARACQEQWTDQTPVPPDTFGPLWPDGLPLGRPERVRAVRTLVAEERLRITVEELNRTGIRAKAATHGRSPALDGAPFGPS